MSERFLSLVLRFFLRMVELQVCSAVVSMINVSCVQCVVTFCFNSTGCIFVMLTMAMVSVMSAHVQVFCLFFKMTMVSVLFADVRGPNARTDQR